jgi:hypothetical protein
MPINDNTPSIFDTFVNEINKGLDEILDTVRKDFNGPKASETEPEEGPIHTPEGTEDVNGFDPLSVEGLAEEAVRLLQAAEETEFVDEGEQLIHIADRYIRLTELALASDLAKQ